MKATLTIQENFLLDFVISSIDEHESLVARLDHLINILPKFDEVQTEIESLEEEFETDEKQNFEDRYFKLVAKCRALLRESQFDPGIQILQEVQQPPSHSQDCHHIQHESIKLPEIKLPIFDGDMTKWHYICDFVSKLITAITDRASDYCSGRIET
mgnify:CR=1 FL=1